MPLFKSDEQIIAAFDAWTLACAVGAENGTVGILIGFERWLSMSRKNWMPTVKARLGWTSKGRIEDVLGNFVRCNCQKHMNTVLREQEEKRGKSPSLVIAHGESITINAEIGICP